MGSLSHQGKEARQILLEIEAFPSKKLLKRCSQKLKLPLIGNEYKVLRFKQRKISVVGAGIK